MADSTTPQPPPPPSADSDPPAKESDASQSQPEGSGLRPGRDSRRTRFDGSASPSPSPSRDGQDGRESLQDQLLTALLKGDLPTFENLARNERIDMKHKYGSPHHSTCLEIACRKPNRGDFVRILLEYVKPNINRVIPEPIHYAAQKGHIDSLRVLLADKRTKVYALNSKGQTALHLACSNFQADRVEDYEQCIRELVPKMSIADLNKPDRNNFTAFHSLVHGPGKKQSLKKRPQYERRLEEESSEPGEARRANEPAGGGGDGGEGGGDTGDAGEAARERLIKVLLHLTQGVLDVDSMRAKGRTAREDVEQRFPQLRAQLPARREQQPRADSHVALVDALRDGNLELFRALLEQTDPDGNPALDPNHAFGYPLHTTCLELACGREERADFVQALLEAGADPNAPNSLSEKYPIHVACEKGHHKELEALLRYSKEINLNCQDKFGNTPLHCTVDRISDDKRREAGRKKCLDLLLKYPQLDVRRCNNAGCTALLLAVEDGNKSVVKTLLGSTFHFKNVDIQKIDLNGKPLRAVIAAQLPAEWKPLLQRPGVAETLKLRRVERNKDLFELLNPIREDDFVTQLQSARIEASVLSKMNDKTFTLLQRAARYGMVKAAKALLDANVDPNETFAGNQSPPGVLASFHRHNNVLELLLEHKNFKLDAPDAKGNTALHYAAKAEKNLETVILLLRHGANMNVQNKLGKSPFGRTQVESLLDQCVRTNGRNAMEEDYELILDYRLLAPGPHRECDVRDHQNTRHGSASYTLVTQNDALTGNENGAVVLHPANNPPECGKLVSEMDFLNMMSKDEELSALLEHPVALSFLQLKWNRLRYLTYFNLVVYVLFMLLLNVFIIKSTKILYVNSDERNDFRDIIPYCAVALIFWTAMAFREFCQLVLDARKYIKSWENYLDWSLLIVSLLSLLLPFTGATLDAMRTINVFTIMLSCIELLLLLGRVSYFAKYIEMLKVVIRNYLLPLLSYAVILVAFGLSFHTLCYERSMQAKSADDSPASTASPADKDEPDFGTWYMSIVMAMVMMIGELEFKSLPDRSPQCIILFVLFVLLVTVVLLNLLTGLAVSDTAKIEDAAQQLQLRSRVGVVLRSERIIVNMHNAECAAARCVPLPACVRARLRRALLFPGSALEGRDGRVKPNLTGELALGEGGGERRWPKRQSLDRATQIICRRGAAAARALTLADVDARVQEVLKAVRVLEERYVPVPGVHTAREPLYSQRSVFSEGALDDWEPTTPKTPARADSF